MRGGRISVIPGFAGAIAAIIATMLLWGFAHRLYASLIPGLGGALMLTPGQSEMARSAVAIGYFLMTLPTAYIARSFGFKPTMIFGLGLFAIGIFLIYPAVQQHSLLVFLAASSLIGSGLAAVEVTSCALAVFLGSRDGAIPRAVLGAVFSPLGALVALALAPSVLASSHNTLVAFLAVVGVAAIALAFVLDHTRFPDVATERSTASEKSAQGFRVLLQTRSFRLGLAGTFLCLFAQIILAAVAPRYCLAKLPTLTPQAAQQFLLWAYVALAAGRLIGLLLYARISPERLWPLFAGGAALCAVASALTTGMVAIALMIGIAFFASVIFPTVFAITLRDLGANAKHGAALVMFVAYSGTGVFALLATIVTPYFMPQVMLIPALCFAAIAVGSLFGGNGQSLSACRGPGAHPTDAAAADPACHRA